MGRNKKLDGNFLSIAKSDRYQCSKCDYMSINLNECDRHILVKHQGQALINNDQNREMTKDEIKQGYRRAIELLKILKCTKCLKTFRSFLGIAMHDEICGKSEQEKFRDCEICGKRLKIHSLSFHMRSIHSTTSAVGLSEESVENENDECNNKEKKRRSAIKAINKFKAINDNNDDDDDDKSVKSVKRLKTDDGDFSVQSSSTEDDDVDDENIGASNHENETKTSKTINDQDLNRIFLYIIIHHLIRVGNDDNDFDERTIKQTIEINDEDGLYKCYSSKCSTKFKYRHELENHYRRCRCRRFCFQCSICNNRFNWIDVNVVEHFFKNHPNLFNDEMKEEFRFHFVKKKNHNQRNPVIHSGTSSLSKRADYLRQLLEWHKQIKLSIIKNGFFSTTMYQPIRQDFIVINENYNENDNTKNFCFKSTMSMDSGDNDMKQLSMFESINLDDDSGSTIMFNVGRYVTAIVWCPLPWTKNSTQFNCKTDFDQIYESEMQAKREQFIMLATSDYNQMLKNERCDDGIFLQLWNIGPLANKKDVNMKNKTRLALNIDWTSYGDVLEMCWCPWGVSYDEINDDNRTDQQQLQRLGLLAIASMDGNVRIISIAHPHQLDQSYRINFVFIVNPVLILQDRFARYMNCTSIDWYPYEPYNMIIGAFNQGYACVWKLPINDESLTKDKRQLLPIDQNGNIKCQPILSIRWINQLMYVCASLTHLYIYHLDWDGLYRQMECRPCQKIISYPPIWSTDFIQMSMIRKGSLIGFILLDTAYESDIRSTIVSNATDTYTDMTLSPWMYTVTFSSESGRLATTKLLKKPGNYKESKSINYILYSTKLASIDQDKQNATNDEKIKKSIIIEDNHDVEYNSNYLMDNKYYLLYEDCKKPDKILQGRVASSSTQLLTKNDLYRYYAINKCTWNPNLCSYSWIFSVNKSGLCRVNNYPLIDPKQLY